MDSEVLKKSTHKGFTTKPNGTGLGLYIVDRLCKEIGAKYSFESIKDEGTVFEMRVPLSIEPRLN
jgi:signal transduction histidine kinase